MKFITTSHKNQLAALGNDPAQLLHLLQQWLNPLKEKTCKTMDAESVNFLQTHLLKIMPYSPTEATQLLARIYKEKVSKDFTYCFHPLDKTIAFENKIKIWGDLLFSKSENDFRLAFAILKDIIAPIYIHEDEMYFKFILTNINKALKTQGELFKSLVKDTLISSMKFFIVKNDFSEMLEEIIKQFEFSEDLLHALWTIKLDELDDGLARYFNTLDTFTPTQLHDKISKYLFSKSQLSSLQVKQYRIELAIQAANTHGMAEHDFFEMIVKYSKMIATEKNEELDEEMELFAIAFAEAIDGNQLALAFSYCKKMLADKTCSPSFPDAFLTKLNHRYPQAIIAAFYNDTQLLVKLEILWYTISSEPDWTFTAKYLLKNHFYQIKEALSHDIARLYPPLRNKLLLLIGDEFPKAVQIWARKKLAAPAEIQNQNIKSILKKNTPEILYVFNSTGKKNTHSGQPAHDHANVKRRKQQA